MCVVSILNVRFCILIWASNDTLGFSQIIWHYILLQAVPVANSIDYKNIEDIEEHPQQQSRRYLLFFTVLSPYRVLHANSKIQPRLECYHSWSVQVLCCLVSLCSVSSISPWSSLASSSIFAPRINLDSFGTGSTKEFPGMLTIHDNPAFSCNLGFCRGCGIRYTYHNFPEASSSLPNCDLNIL